MSSTSKFESKIEIFIEKWDVFKIKKKKYLMKVKTNDKAIFSTFGHCQIRKQQKRQMFKLYSWSNIDPKNIIFA